MRSPTSDGLAAPLVVVVADDLIWSDRLARAVRAAGAQPRPVRDLASLAAALADPAAPAAWVVVDLTARAYDGVEAVAAASAGGCRVLAVGQHDDAASRRAAVAAGAERVLAYRKLADDGPDTLARWLGLRR